MLEGEPKPPGAGDAIVLALARGVLSGLAESNGIPRWSLRVGVDTSVLPDRFKVNDLELCLVVSADTHSLLALRVDTGDQLWRYPLGGPRLGRPIVFENRAFVPTYDGVVHELDLTLGRLLGRYILGQRLTVGGARQPGTKLLYFPADDSCIFVLDVGQQRCQSIIFSNHPSGSLRSEPILASWGSRTPEGVPDPNGPGILILPQADGIDSMVLQHLHAAHSAGHRPGGAQPDGSAHPRLVVVPAVLRWRETGDGHGRRPGRHLWRAAPRQPGQEPLQVAWRRLSRKRRPGADGAPGATQVVYGRDSDLWILAQGKLHRLRLNFGRTSGPLIVPLWDEPQALGSPLHAGRVDEKATALFIVSQSLSRQVCYATAVEAEQGRIRWKRQLGLVCQGEPLALGKTVLIQDQGGGVFLFDPAQPEAAGRMVLRPLPGEAIGIPYLVPSADGSSAIQFASLPKDKNRFELLLRFYPPQPGAAGSVEIGAPLAGRPAVGKSFVLLPLADGTLVRLTLDGKNKKEGPDWCARQADAKLPAFVAWLSEDEFLASNGQRGLVSYRWPAEGDYEKLYARACPARGDRAARPAGPGRGRRAGVRRGCRGHASSIPGKRSARAASLGAESRRGRGPLLAQWTHRLRVRPRPPGLARPRKRTNALGQETWGRHRRRTAGGGWRAGRRGPVRALLDAEPGQARRAHRSRIHAQIERRSGSKPAAVWPGAGVRSPDGWDDVPVAGAEGVSGSAPASLHQVGVFLAKVFAEHALGPIAGVAEEHLHGQAAFGNAVLHVVPRMAQPLTEVFEQGPANAAPLPLGGDCQVPQRVEGGLADVAECDVGAPVRYLTVREARTSVSSWTLNTMQPTTRSRLSATMQTISFD